MKNINKKFNSKGLTLIETIISMAILAIIAVVFLSIFSSGMSWMFKAGHRTNLDFVAQKAIDNEIAGAYTGGISGMTNTRVDNSDFRVNFQDVVSGGNTYISISGDEISMEYVHNGQTVILKSFVPD